GDCFRYRATGPNRAWAEWETRAEDRANLAAKPDGSSRRVLRSHSRSHPPRSFPRIAACLRLNNLDYPFAWPRCISRQLHVIGGTPKRYEPAAFARTHAFRAPLHEWRL